MSYSMHSFSKPAAYTTHDALQMLQIEQRLGCLPLVAADVARAASLGHRSGNLPSPVTFSGDTKAFIRLPSHTQQHSLSPVNTL